MANSNNPVQLSENRNPWTSFVILLVFVFLGLFVGQFLGLLALLPWMEISQLTDPNYLPSILSNPEFKRPIMIMNACVALGAFILAPLAYLFVVEKKKISIFFNNNNKIGIPLILTIFIVIAFMSVNSIFIEWNANLVLPEYLKSFEIWAQEMERQAQELTLMMTRFDGFGDLLFGLLIIALIPAVGEEILFRGLLQNQLFAMSKNMHVAIWVGGFIFSAIHLQFYGLVPRMFLGVLFGYLYYWSGNLWVPILGHFINNGLTLVLLYLYQTDNIAYDIESTTSIPIANVIISLVVGVGLIVFFRKIFSTRSNGYG